MKKMISMCGYRCDLCTVYRDNLERIGRDEVRAGFVKYFHSELDDEILKGCQGCPASGDENCSVKACAGDKKIANCGLCREFPCDKVREKMNVIKKYFDDVSALSKWDRDHYVEPYRSEERLHKIQEESKKRP
jgi:hypothetical protein